MLRSGIVRSLAGPCLFFTILSAAVVAYHDVQRFYFPRLPPPPYLTLAPFTLTSFALSLLLVFRTNSSYSRWWEARAQWGKVVNRSRDIVRMSLAYMDPDMAAVTVKWTKVFPIALKCHLRDDPTLKPKLARAGLTPRELDAVLAAKHHPNFILQASSPVDGFPLAWVGRTRPMHVLTDVPNGGRAGARELPRQGQARPDDPRAYGVQPDVPGGHDGWDGAGA